jgi:ATP-dependent Clp protease ATP-binding subunit ClpA
MARLSASTKRVFLFAVHEAYRQKSAKVEPEHVLLGLSQIPSEAQHLLHEIGITFNKLCAVIGENVLLESNDPPPYSQAVQSLSARAAELAVAGGKTVQPEMLLRAMLEDAHGGAMAILTKVGAASVLKQRLDVNASHEA